MAELVPDPDADHPRSMAQTYKRRLRRHARRGPGRGAAVRRDPRAARRARRRRLAARRRDRQVRPRAAPLPRRPRSRTSASSRCRPPTAIRPSRTRRWRCRRWPRPAPAPEGRYSSATPAGTWDGARPPAPPRSASRWGYHDAAELIAAGADAVAERPADVLASGRAIGEGAPHDRRACGSALPHFALVRLSGARADPARPGDRLHRSVRPGG